MWTLKILGFATLLLIAGPAVIMEALYVSQMLGAGLAAGVMLAAVIGFHLLKALLPFLAASDLTRASRCSVWALWGGLVLLSLVASVGFLSLEREIAFTRRLGASSELQAMEASLAADRARLGRLSHVRDARVIEADMAAALMTAGAATRNCDGSVLATAKVLACRDVARLRVELEEARAADRLRASIAEAEGRLGWKAQTSGADPQAEVFVRLTGANVRAVQTALIVMLALVMEAAAALLPWLLFRPDGWCAPGKPNDDQRVEPGKENESSAPANTNDNEAPARPTADVIPIRQHVERFADACLETVDGAAVNGGKILSRYACWCAREGIEPRRSNDVIAALREALPIERRNGRGNRVEYRGVRLKAA